MMKQKTLLPQTSAKALSSRIKFVPAAEKSTADEHVSSLALEQLRTRFLPRMDIFRTPDTFPASILPSYAHARERKTPFRYNLVHPRVFASAT
ncbi:hypothetical protein PsorP6_000546 [Peronosclerospora sorghi]|uniref:Uncharacterized protein n=1 Tax=Peronosclerospora sorghi TaxID=230839 RepID=A0ACC0WTU7_9STRA|nr:hypothetical protein PsorP6_000546 [Peronosclerospora sorghi]